LSYNDRTSTTKIPVVAVIGAVVNALAVLTVGVLAVVCDSVENVVGIPVLSVKHTYVHYRGTVALYMMLEFKPR